MQRVERSSALNNPTTLTKVQFLRVQAEGDTTVTPDQACELASKLPGSVNFYLNPQITPPGAGVYYGRPKECSAFSMPWMNYPAPAYNGPPAVFPPDGGRGGMWSTPTLLVYSGLDHVAIMGKAWPEVQASSTAWHSPAAGTHHFRPPSFSSIASDVSCRTNPTQQPLSISDNGSRGVRRLSRCSLSHDGSVSKRLRSRVSSGRSPHRFKIKKPPLSRYKSP
jgi:hypothetical protein